MDKKEWQEENLKIADRMKEHYKRYRKRTCSICDIEQKEKRNCINIDGETQCCHMINTTAKKFRNEIHNQFKLKISDEAYNKITNSAKIEYMISGGNERVISEFIALLIKAIENKKKVVEIEEKH